MSKSKDIVFDANTFGPNEVPCEVITNNERAGYSHDVLIDLDGTRTHFSVGYYLFDDYRPGTGEWMLYKAGQEVDPENMRWSFLPLAIYDTHPELRQTIKL
jgi:hypothetical protein